MNSIMQDQISKIKQAGIVVVDKDGLLHINKVVIPTPDMLKVGSYYLIELSNSILNPMSGSTLAANWNHGKIPRYKTYKVEVNQKMSNMIKVNGIPVVMGTDVLGENFSGWLPFDSIKVIESY